MSVDDQENMNIESNDFIKTKLPTVAIVGRPNVGKSSLFNAILGKRISIVHEESGVTRDSVIAPKRWRGNYFQIIDTGGLGSGQLESNKKDSFFDTKICSQVEVAVESADLLIMVTDVTAGVTALDVNVAKTLRKCGKKTIVVVNKVDNPEMVQGIDVFNTLGFTDILPVSCVHRRGITEVLECFTEKIEKITDYKIDTRLAITVAGRPNVGKSSIINKIVGKDTLIVSDIAGTTRDAVDMPFDLQLPNEEPVPATLVDTAGLRKRGKADSAVEVYSVMRANDAIKRSDIVLLIIEADGSGATAQDAKIGRIISDCGKGCIIVANKWDKCTGLKQKEIVKEIRYKLPFLTYAPIVFTCATSGYNVKPLLAEIAMVNEQYKVVIPTSTVNRVLTDAQFFNPPPCVTSKFFKIFYATMVSNKPPLFTMFVNDPKLCPANYLAYLKNYLRKAFNLHGLPIHLKMKKRQAKTMLWQTPEKRRKYSSRKKPKSKITSR